MIAAKGAGTAKNILDYNAIPDGKTLNTKAIQRAIDEAFQAGGGLVYAPPGTFLTGGLELKSRVTLYVDAGCVLLGSPNIADYAYHPGPPMLGDAQGHHLIFAQNADDVSLCGPGVIDGQGEAYWEPNPDRPPAKPEDEWHDVASGHFQTIHNNSRPSPMVEFVQCRNVRISEVTLKNSSGWTLRPINCESVFIDGVRIRNPFWGRNTDGMDITSCRNVFVSNCDIVGGDVEIGANVTIDRGALGPTVIGKGTKIDNLVQIAHNVEIGEGSLIISQVGISGSCKFGKYVILAGQAGFAGHLKIGDHVTVSAQSGVMTDIPDGEKWLGSPAQPDKQAKRQYIAIQHLPELLKRVAELEKKLGGKSES